MASRTLGAAAQGATLPGGRGLATVATHVGAGKRVGDKRWIGARLGLVGGINRNGGGPRGRGRPSVGIGIVGGRARTCTRMAGVARQRCGQGQVLRMGAGNARESGTGRTRWESRRACVAGQAGASPGGNQRGIGQGVTDGTEGGGGIGRSTRVGVAVGAIGRENGGGGGQVAVALHILLPRQEGHWMGHVGEGPVIDRGQVDVAVAGQGACPTALGRAGHRVGARC